MAQSVTCPACKRQFAYKPQLAGKRVRCKCGGAITFPAVMPGEADIMDVEPESPPAAPPGPRGGIVDDPYERKEVPSDPYAIAGETRSVTPPPVQASAAVCRSCQAALAPGAVLCLRCGVNQQTGAAARTQVLGAARPAAARTTKSSEGGGSGLRNLLIGGGVCLLGVVVTVIGLTHPDADGRYRFMIGAIILGGIQAVRGLIQLISGDS
jgi:hypothetical protein